MTLATRLAQVRATLHAEYPHAVTAIDLLMRGLREGKPAVVKPVVLVGDPGCGKSRLIRRLSALLSLFVYRFDCAGTSDGHFSGTAKTWAATEPCIPFRAVAQSLMANPVVMLDEIEKAGNSPYNGGLHQALLPFLQTTETAARYRDQSLEAEVDISACSFIATSNDASKLPGTVRDRMRLIRVPSPSMVHLPALAASVVRDMAAHDEMLAHVEPFADDELAVMGRAWESQRFSMRALQRIVTATLDAREQTAPRH